MFDISASLVLYNTDISLIKNVLDSFFINHNLKVKMFIVDNSPQQNENYIQLISNYSNCEYFYLGKNIGYGSANNFAIKMRKENYRYHLVLNPDIKFDGLILDDITKFMDNNKNVGLLMPKVLNEDGTIQYLCKLLPTPQIWLSRAIFGNSKFTKSLNFNFEFRFSNYDKIISVPYLSGCFMFIRNCVFHEVGYFDENIFLHTEDVDFSRRIFEKYDNIYYPNVYIYHGFNKETYKNIKVLYYHVKSTIYYFNKWGWFFDKKRTDINKSILNKFCKLKTL